MLDLIWKFSCEFMCYFVVDFSGNSKGTRAVMMYDRYIKHQLVQFCGLKKLKGIKTKKKLKNTILLAPDISW